jgi:putative nucleotide binding protein
MTTADGDDVEAETEAGSERQPTRAVVLDFLPHGRPDSDRPRYEQSPVAYALETERFRLLELAFEDDPDVGIGDWVVVDPPAERETVVSVREVGYDDVSNTARSEVEFAVEAIVDDDERRFVDFYNDAQPITLRLHQLNLLPGIGKKLRNNVLDERKRGPFESFEELSERVSGLHNPREVVVERIMEELREEDLKYKTFVREE